MAALEWAQADPQQDRGGGSCPLARLPACLFPHPLPHNVPSPCLDRGRAGRGLVRVTDRVGRGAAPAEGARSSAAGGMAPQGPRRCQRPRPAPGPERPRPAAPRPARTDLPAAARGRVPTAAPRPWRRRRAAARCPTAGAAPGPSAGCSSQPVLIAAPAPPAAQTPAGATWVGPAALGAPRRRGPGCAAAPARRGRLCAPAAPLPARPPRLPASPAPDGLAPWPPLIEVPPPPASRRHQGLDHSPPIS